MGAAGCGKTALATVAALEGLLSNIYDYILLTRINIESGNTMGFLKGTEAEKNAPWVEVMLEELRRWGGKEVVRKLMEEKKIIHKPI